MLKKSFIGKMLDYAVSCGADYAEVFFEDVERTEINLVDMQVTGCACGRESGIGVRVFWGLESRYLYSADTTEEKVLKLLKEHLDTRGVFGKRTPLSKVSPHGIVIPGRYPRETELKKKISFLREGISAGKSEENCIVQGRARCTDTDQRVQIANTEGVYAEDRRVRTRVRFTMVAADEGYESRQTGYAGPGVMGGPEFLESDILIDRVREAAGSAKRMLGAQPCPVGRMPVIIANGFGGLFFHEACGHSLEGSSVANGCSEFADKLGEKIASERLRRWQWELL